MEEYMYGKAIALNMNKGIHAVSVDPENKTTQEKVVMRKGMTCGCNLCPNLFRIRMKLWLVPQSRGLMIR